MDENKRHDSTLAHKIAGGVISEPVAAQLIAGFAVLLASLLGGKEGEQ